jgi:hypothetical protein
VVFECKVSGDPWIVRKAELDDDQRSWRPIASRQLASYLASKESPVPRWIRLDDPTALSLVVGAPNKDEQAYAALSQLVSAAIGWRARHEAEADRPIWVHPILMIDAPLFSLHYDQDGAEALAATAHERLLWSGYHGLSDPVLVDIWTPSYLVEGMELLATALPAIAERIPNQDWRPPGSAGF